MITLQDFNDLYANIENSINSTLDEIKNNDEANYVLLIADGDYMPNIGANYVPYVIDFRGDIYSDETRRNFLNTILNNFYSFDKNKIIIPFKTVIVEDNPIQISMELMVYSHIWESEYYLKKCSRIAHLLKNKKFKWNIKIPPLQKSNFIKNDIIKNLSHINCPLEPIFRDSYNTKLRNSFAHSSYSLDSKKGSPAKVEE